MKHLSIAKLAVLLLSLGILLAGCGQEAPETLPVETLAAAETTGIPTTEAATIPTETEPQEERFLLTFTGDCTFGSNPTNYFAGYGFIKTVGEDYSYPFRNVIGYFEKDELSLINLGGPLTDSGNPMQKKHAFRGPTAYTAILTENSIEAVSIANNHTLDYGQTGYESTLSALDAAGIPYVQRDASTVLTTKNGLTIGLYGAVYYLLDVEDMVQEITALKDQGCDLIIFAPHWGTEGTYRPTAEQVRVGHAAIDAGAHIVWGSHPHVLQPIENYNGGIIFYSLGNFSFGGDGYPQDYDSALLQQEIIRDETGVHLGALTIVPCNVSSVPDRNNFQPTPYEKESPEYRRVLSKLDGTFDGPNLKIN